MPRPLDLAEIKAEARRELEAERRRALIDKAKQEITRRRWWHQFIPVITITWRSK